MNTIPAGWIKYHKVMSCSNMLFDRLPFGWSGGDGTVRLCPASYVVRTVMSFANKARQHMLEVGENGSAVGGQPVTLAGQYFDMAVDRDF